MRVVRLCAFTIAALTVVALAAGALFGDGEFVELPTASAYCDDRAPRAMSSVLDGLTVPAEKLRRKYSCVETSDGYSIEERWTVPTLEVDQTFLAVDAQLQRDGWVANAFPDGSGANYRGKRAGVPIVIVVNPLVDEPGVLIVSAREDWPR